MTRARGAELYVGVSGFSYASWKGEFYPAETKSEDFLSYYSKHLGSVEINSSFYSPPREATVKGWAQRTEKRFRFAFKAPQLITHVLKLGKGSVDAALRFSRTVELLGPRRGPILFQLPPYTKYDEELLSGFLSGTSGIGNRVFEFRHKSWFQDRTFELLDSSGAGFCIAETEDMEPVFRTTGSLAYFRLRRESYERDTIDSWASKIRQAVDGLPKAFVYLRHDETGANALLAERLYAALTG